jgi:glycosyltransferase involved in cell wall biosynthesis
MIGIEPKAMRIVIDLQGAQTGSRHRGIGRYTLSLVKAMLAEHHKNEYYIVLNGMFPETIDDIRDQLEGYIDQSRIRIWYAQSPVGMSEDANLGRVALAEYIREAFIHALKPDYLLLTSLCEGFGDNFACSINKYFRVPTAVILYDLIPMLNPDIYLPNRHIVSWYFGKLAEMTKADLLLSISAASGREAIDHLGVSPDSVVNISGATDGSFTKTRFAKTEITEAYARFGIDRSYLMYTSATDERKNHRGLITAYSRLPIEMRNKFQLVFAGGLPHDHKAAFIKHASSAGLMIGEMVITGHVTDAELNLLYNQCHSFIFPSWHEGLGLPILEAMQCGKAVIASNRSSIPEVVGLDASLFDPFDIQSMTDMIVRLLGDEPFRRSLERHAVRQVKRFSWEHSAQVALAAIEARVGDPRPAQRLDTEVINRIRAESTLEHILPRCTEMAVEAGVSGSDLSTYLSITFAAGQLERQLLVDVTELVRGDARTGIQRVVRSILSNWLKSPPAGWRVRPVYARYKLSGLYYAPENMEDILAGKVNPGYDDPVEVWPGDKIILLDFSPFDIHLQMEVLLDWRQRGINISTVVYDLLPTQFPQFFPEDIPPVYRRWLDCIAQFDEAFCISRSVADDLGQWMTQNAGNRVRPLKINWFHLGNDIENSHPSAGLPANALAMLNAWRKKPTFLIVGTVELRKAHLSVFKAFEQLWKGGLDINLVFVGKQGWRVEAHATQFRIRQKMNQNFFWLEDASDEMLDQVYRASACVIVASFGEGFGLPLIEAANHDIPIIARDIPVFREVAGAHATYFADSNNPAIIANCVKKWLDQLQFGTVKKSNQIKLKSWAETSADLSKFLIDEHNEQKKD